MFDNLRLSFSASSTPASSPLLGSAPAPGGLCQAWLAEAPSRQSTSGSTVASESDLLGRASPLPDALRDSRMRHGLAAVKERRGWHHFFRSVVRVPLAFAIGLLLGVTVATAIIVGFGVSRSPQMAGGLTAGPPLSEAQAPYAKSLPPSQVPASYLAAEPLDNSCLIKDLVIPEGPQTFDACSFVIRSTDEVWNLRGDVDAAIEKYFHEDYIDAGSWGRRIIGKRDLRDAVLSEMRAFPDIQIHITDCVCRGNDNDGYKCSMPDVLTGTNHGPSSYGPPTGRFARWTGMVESLVKRDPATGQWQYYAEWGVHDEWSLIQQLGLDFARVPRPMVNNEPIHDCAPLFKFGPQPIYNRDDLADQEQHDVVKRLS